MIAKKAELYDPERFVRFAEYGPDRELARMLAEQFSLLLGNSRALSFPAELPSGAHALFDMSRKHDGTGYVVSVDEGNPGGFGSATIRRTRDGGWELLPGYAPGSRAEELRDEGLSMVYHLVPMRIPSNSSRKS